MREEQDDMIERFPFAMSHKGAWLTFHESTGEAMKWPRNN